MKRVLLSLILLTVLFPVESKALKVSSKISPVAYQNKNGELALGIFLKEDIGEQINPFQQSVQVRICGANHCEVYDAMSQNSWEGYSLHYWRSIIISLDDKFKNLPITAQVPADFVNGANGWSIPSNEVIVSSTPPDIFDFYRKQISRPPIEIIYSSLDPTGMKRVDLCRNYREGIERVSTHGTSRFVRFDLDLSGYSNIRYDLYENGRLKTTKPINPVDQYGNMPMIPACDSGSLGSFLLTSIDGLKAGTKYKLMYTLSGQNKEELTATLDFVTPGACPTGEVILPPSPRTFHYGILNEAGILVSYQFAHWWGEDLPSRMAPIFHSGSKVSPFNGNLYEIRTSSEKWRFLSGVDEWALVLDDATTQAPSDMLAHTVFAGCRPAQVTTRFSLDESTLSAAEQSCAISNNKIVPVRPGICMIEASITSRRVKSSTAKATKPTVISMNYVISKVAKTKKLKNGAKVTPRTRAQNAQILPATSLLSPSRGARVVRITTRTNSVCRPQGTSLRMLKKGKCRYTATIVRKGKTSTVSSVIRVS